MPSLTRVTRTRLTRTSTRMTSTRITRTRMRTRMRTTKRTTTTSRTTTPPPTLRPVQHTACYPWCCHIWPLLLLLQITKLPMRHNTMRKQMAKTILDLLGVVLGISDCTKISIKFRPALCLAPAQGVWEDACGVAAFSGSIAGVSSEGPDA